MLNNLPEKLTQMLIIFKIPSRTEYEIYFGKLLMKLKWFVRCVAKVDEVPNNIELAQ